MNDIAMIQGLIERAKEEITDDIMEGIVPSSVGSFSELHDYTDANMYGGLCDDDVLPDDADAMIDLANAVQNAVDTWIKAGRPQ